MNGFGLLLSVISLSCIKTFTVGDSCDISLPHDASGECLEERSEELQQRRLLYRFKSPPEYDYPVADINLLRVIGSDAALREWAYKFGTLKNNTIKVYNQWVYQSEPGAWTFAEMYNFFIDRRPSGSQYEHPWEQDKLSAVLLDIVNKDRWKDDSVFTDQRFAGVNPMAIQKVTFDESKGILWSELEKKLNPSFDWSGAVSCVIGEQVTIAEAARKGLLYVLRYPLLDEAITMPEYHQQATFNGRSLMNVSSPIALFATTTSTPSCDKSDFIIDVKRDDDVGDNDDDNSYDADADNADDNEDDDDIDDDDDYNDDDIDDDNDDDGMNESKFKIYPVAIQEDHKPDSCVYTPKDGDYWLFAKASLQMADIYDSLFYQHILKIHVVMETLCLSINRHFPHKHPLYQVLRYHCGPVIPLAEATIRPVIDPEQLVRRLTALGSDGARKLMNDGYRLMDWKELGFLYGLKKRGMLDKKKVPYFPYRDDGLRIMRVIKLFIRHYVKMYYTNDDVRNDSELQKFADEVSANGTSALGKLRGFPAVIRDTDELIDVMSQIVWIAAGQHSALNFPSILYSSFPPNTPAKLYHYGEDVYSKNRLPPETVALEQLSLGMNVGTLRFDHLLDYGRHLEDERAKNLVIAFETWLRHQTQTIDDENKRRVENGHLPYPFLRPDLITNSVAS